MVYFTIILLSTDEMVCPKCTAEDEMFTWCPLTKITCTTMFTSKIQQLSIFTIKIDATLSCVLLTFFY